MSGKDKVNILLVDDQPAKIMTYETILKDLDENLISAGSGREAFNQLLKHDYALVLIDVGLPDLDGFQLAAMMRDHPRFEKTPIIFVSAIHLTEFDRLRGYESGAVDYVSVPIVPEILRAKVKVFIDLHRATRELKHMNEVLEERVEQRTTELQMSNQRLQESEERLRLAGDAAQFGTYDFDVASGQIHCSPQLMHLIGLRQSDETEMTLDAFVQLVHDEERDAVRQCLMGTRRGADDRHHLEFRIVRSDGTVSWLLDRGRAFFKEDNGQRTMRVMGTVLDITERKQTEERQLLLMAELDHRVKNILANVSAIARLSSRRPASVDEFVHALDARIQAISRAHSMLRRDSSTGINLEHYLRELLAPFLTSSSVNIRFEGEEIWLKPKAAQSLVLVFHELATNAAKYGALSTPGGDVSISWKRTRTTGSNGMSLVWCESGGPQTHSNTKHGFGLSVIRAACNELGAETEHAFTSTGVRFSLSGPLEQTGKPRVAHAAADKLDSSDDGEIIDELRCRILVVEDEVLVAMQVKEDLESSGHIVVGPAQTVDQGLALVEREQIDFAFLDLQLGDELSIPIAEHLLRRGVPFAFTTGFDDHSILPKQFHQIPCLTKPYAIGGLSRFILNNFTRLEKSDRAAAKQASPPEPTIH